ncbi:MAG: MutS-related protein [Croceimicrobium sp.]
MAERSAFLERQKTQALHDARFLKRRIRIISWSRLALVLTLLLSSYWAMQVDGPSQLLGLWIPGIPIFLLLVRWYEDLKDKLKFKEALVAIADEEISAINGDLIREFSVINHDKNHPFSRELDLFGPQSIHHHINRAWTNAGAEFLAEEMKSPPFKDWQARQDYFKELEADQDWAFQYRAEGQSSGEQKDVKAVFNIWAKDRFKAFPAFYWPIMIVGIILVWYTAYGFVSAPAEGSFKLFMYAISFNLLVLGSRVKVLREQQSKLTKVSAAISSYAALLQRLESRSFISAYGKEFKSKFKLDEGVALKVKRLGALLNSLDQSANVMALFILNGLFHYHLFRLRALEQWHKKYSSELSLWLQGLHQFEAHLSYANYHANHPEFNWPSLEQNPEFRALALGHPLIPAKQRVTNDLDLNAFKYSILTGSNMSGKSTFLRSIGINMVLAQLGAKVCAEQLHIYPFQLLCSMNPQDDLRAETSYFQAEIIRLKSLLDRLNEEQYSFFLLDEILRGTNSDDKQAGTRKFLNKIEEAPAWGFIATHDVDIAHLADDNQHFNAAYFESKVQGEDLVFDYKLRSGVCKTPNASLLMERYGLV